MSVTTVDLVAGQTIRVGTVTIENDNACTVRVTYQTTGGWVLTETHLAVEKTLAEIPQANGNPIPGRFDRKMTHDPPVTTYNYNIPAEAGWELGVMLYVAAHAEVRPSLPAISPSQVVSFMQGPRQDGSPVLPDRSDPQSALITGDNRFFSLGFGGTLTVGFGAPLAAGQQIRIIETTWGACRAEVVRVDASQDGTDWFTIGVATNGRLPPGWLGSDNTPTVLSVGASGVRFIRMTDVSDRTSFPWYQDGFDVESIAAVGGLGQAETAWSAGKPFSGSNWATYTEHRLGAATSTIAKFVADAAPVAHKIDVMET